MITKQSLFNEVVSGECRATLGKRKATSIREGHLCDISAFVCGGIGDTNPLHANVWIEDQKGRQIAVELPAVFLLELAQSIQAINKRSEK